MQATAIKPSQSTDQTEPAPRAAARSLLRKLLRRPAGAMSLALISLLLLLLLLGPLVAPYDYGQQNIPARLQGPSAQYWLGTDHLGRDLLSRLIYGTRVALGTAIPAVVGALLLGLIFGLLAGYAGGIIESVILVISDTAQAFPAVILALALMALLGPSTQNVILVIALAFAPGYVRVVRAQVLQIKGRSFIDAVHALGASDLQVVWRHILPNILPPLVILLAMDLPSAITIEAGLSFLGLGVKPPTPSWGVILADGFGKIRNSPWPVLWASLTLMLSTLGFTFFGETLRDLLDPTLAGTRRA